MLIMIHVDNRHHLGQVRQLKSKVKVQSRRAENSQEEFFRQRMHLRGETEVRAAEKQTGIGNCK